MDGFERVREVNTGASLTEDRVSRARSRLLDGIHAGRVAERKRLVRRPMFLIAGAVATVTAVTATVVVISQPTAPSPRVEAVPVATGDPRTPGETIPRPESTAGAVVTEPFPGTTPQAGQYLRVESDIERLHYRDAQGVAFNWTSYQGTPPSSALLTRDRMQLYVPADRAADWYNEQGPFSERVQYFPEEQSPADESAWEVSLPTQPEVNGGWSTGGLGGDAFPIVGSTAYYDAIPRDPQALLDGLRVKISGWTSTQHEADDALLEHLTFDLLLNIAPADVREAYIGALSLSSLVQTDSTGDGTIRFQFRRDLYHPRTETISVDAATGWVTEHDVRYDRPDGAESDMVPTSVPDIRTRYTVSIVNSAP